MASISKDEDLTVLDCQQWAIAMPKEAPEFCKKLLHRAASDAEIEMYYAMFAVFNVYSMCYDSTEPLKYPSQKAFSLFLALVKKIKRDKLFTNEEGRRVACKGGINSFTVINSKDSARFAAKTLKSKLEDLRGDPESPNSIDQAATDGCFEELSAIIASI